MPQVLFIFEGARLNYELTYGEVPGTLYGLSNKGWIDESLFFSWFTELFIKNIPPARPVLLLLDGHSTHYTPDVVLAAAKEGVVMLCLPPHTTHAMQPLDVSFFKSLKSHWSDVCHKYMVNNPGRVVTKFQFSSLFREAWVKAIKPESIISGFQKCGVYPFNPNAVSIPDHSQLSDGCSSINQLSFGDSEQISNADPKLSDDDPNSLDNSHNSLCDIVCTSDPSYLPSNDQTLSFDDSISHTSSEHHNDISGCPSDFPPISNSCDDYTVEELLRFENRYDNGYNIYTDERYVQWLCKNHPDVIAGQQTEDVSLNTITHSTPNVAKKTSPSSSKSKDHNIVIETTPSRSPISQFLTIPKSRPLKKKMVAPRTDCRVLTSAESLSMIEEKEQQKKQEEEKREERKREREKRKLEKEAEKKKREEEREKKAAERKRKNKEKEELKVQKAKEKELKKGHKFKTQTGKQPIVERGVQNNEISSSECAICFGTYDEDMSDGILTQAWIECPLQDCAKWMHEDCVEKDEFQCMICPLCNTMFN